MYALSFASRTFFCCEPGQYGALPISGYSGICEPIDQNVASSLVATPASQIGATGIATAVVQPATTGTVTSTLKNGYQTTILTTLSGGTATGAVTGTGSGSFGTAGTGQATASSSTLSISKGALIAIIACAIVVPLIALITISSSGGNGKRKREERDSCVAVGWCMLLAPSRARSVLVLPMRSSMLESSRPMGRVNCRRLRCNEAGTRERRSSRVAGRVP
ncbi:hypothetical protein L207DRAFT_1838 [Hyaloscypha variabilis F]|uniref:Uncharacterized protein n=1 Tax=Hyaloscypha variabilis (strain UAMH 11265 / GT02V1 / F) TaxID=1149755 RepID=A0A2J6SBL6_HYAVF|nr:hypothetical protein L207DRAFT_1838 [Hyaloscypha variabilis F]